MVSLPPKEERTSAWLCGRYMTIVNGNTEERQLAHAQILAHLKEEDREHLLWIEELKRSNPVFRQVWESRHGNQGS